jgi:hypothetical protein
MVHFPFSKTSTSNTTLSTVKVAWTYPYHLSPGFTAGDEMLADRLPTINRIPGTKKRNALTGGVCFAAAPSA